jgi:hypothetical protein
VERKLLVHPAAHPRNDEVRFQVARANASGWHPVRSHLPLRRCRGPERAALMMCDSGLQRALSWAIIRRHSAGSAQDCASSVDALKPSLTTGRTLGVWRLQ